MDYAEELLDLFAGQLSISEIKNMTFGELNALVAKRRRRISAQNNNRDAKNMQKSMRNMSRIHK